ncbi:MULTISPECIES: hypothetical protein [unclassified Streptomyces]|uniref:hypothetical protein n=1 Tax=unclassified Streptomyces TaxID=2593676 RepID=UPI002ED29D8F|nr:hypothetical protein [Streptomyces sp. BE230]
MPRPPHRALRVRAVPAGHPTTPAPHHRGQQSPSPGARVTDEPDRTPPPISTSRKPRLATVLFRRYLRAVTVGSGERTIPLVGGRPEAALDEARRRDALLLVDSYRLRRHD